VLAAEAGSFADSRERKGEGPMALAIVLISAEPGEDRKVANEVRKLKGVEKVFLVSGLYDVVARIQGASTEEILGLVYDKIRPIPGIKNSHTMFALEA
jgi:DNA-binding Lrp family transcriptional regulator